MEIAGNRNTRGVSHKDIERQWVRNTAIGEQTAHMDHRPEYPWYGHAGHYRLRQRALIDGHRLSGKQIRCYR